MPSSVLIRKPAHPHVSINHKINKKVRDCCFRFLLQVMLYLLQFTYSNGNLCSDASLRAMHNAVKSDMKRGNCALGSEKYQYR